MISGIHVVRKARRNRPPFWYVYAYRGGPQILRHEGWERPRLGKSHLDKLRAATDAKIRVAPVAETLSRLIEDWQKSPEWNAFARNTQKTWGSQLKVIDDRWGNLPLSIWNDPRMTSKVVNWRDSRANQPRAADNGVIVLRALLKFGRLHGKVVCNAADGIPHLYRNANRAEIIWTEADMSAFCCAAEAQAMHHVIDGLRLAALTGLRREDLVTLTWAHVRQATIEKHAIKKSRGKRWKVVIPILPELAGLLSELRTRSRAEGIDNVLVNSRGQQWTGDGFGGSFNRVRDAAGICHIDEISGQRRTKHIHDLRGTYCTRMIKAGVTNDEIADIMGWSPQQVAGIRKTYVDQGHAAVAVAKRVSGVV
ncbi:tyrosine-type recombinase/integrase [Novosphingobium acidiphilum]|uniref:tyrosine-type recombinase/integrase n=1 Tax=Novosphingobium acidiphilum TaxID=505248 RepID=UPI0012EC1EAF|nr:tyrosine-type recombinase/integrase [Novosphingobium acidiphilum]